MEIFELEEPQAADILRRLLQLLMIGSIQIGNAERSVTSELKMLLLLFLFFYFLNSFIFFILDLKFFF